MQEAQSQVPGGQGAAQASQAAPRRHLDVRHAMAVCVGMVIGAGIFRTAPNVAQSLMHAVPLFSAWTLGGVLSLLGALCFAEMAAAFPHAGGDYTFLSRAYGRRLALFFAWSRFSVIHTGSMALLAFVCGDYLAQLVNFGVWSSPIFGVVTILVLIAVNLRGIRLGLGTQVGFMALVLFGLACVVVGAVWVASHGAAPLTSASASAAVDDHTSFGTAMVFVLLAYGGWSDAATLSAEMRDERRGIVIALVGGMSIVAALYLAVNWGYLRVLGFDGLAQSQAPAADVMRLAFGRPGEVLIVFTVTTAAVSIMNALLIVGARTTFAAARDLSGLGHLDSWDVARGTPTYAMLAMGAVAIVLIGFGTLTRGGFSTMVDYLAPVYWFFLSLSALAVIVLRVRYPDVPRPFRVPGYPLTPILFFLSCLYTLYASLHYVQIGALVGVAVLALGGFLLLFERK
ncbi:MAG TPA: APC family permease [Burkholderiaceae bacterium]|nr:APC family permease [Burkholderiaceae bacterium]